MFKRIESSKPTKLTVCTSTGAWYSFDSTPPMATPGNEFDADPITPNNWEGGEICDHIRGSKKRIWAFKMWLPEGFTITINGQKIRGNPGNWLIIEGNEKYIVTERMFRKKFRRCADE